MATFILRRLVQLVPVLIGITLIAFVLMHVLPGDPVRMLMPRRADPETVARIRAKYHLDDPLFIQYVGYLGRALRGDLGRSLRTHQPVTRILRERFAPTAHLALGAILFAVVTGIAAGVLSAVRPHSALDYAAMLLALVGVSMPVFWLGMMLISFVATRVPFLPISGYQGWASLILPSIALGTIPAAVVARLTRSSMIESLGQDYVRTARAKGARPWAVVMRHALRNSLIPIVTVIGTSFASLLSGAVLTETVFNIPGLGSKIVGAIFQRDYPVVVGGVLWLACTFVLVNLAVDVAYAFIDPRIRYDRADVPAK